MTDAQLFIDRMTAIWEIATEAFSDGGLCMIASELYDEWHNANDVARRDRGAIVAPTTWNRQKAYIRRFLDGSRVIVTRDGDAVKLARPLHRSEA